MSRLARSGLNASFFHVMCQGINKEMIFEHDNEKMKYLSIMNKNIKKVEVQIVSYCIMTNHVHILIYSEQIDKISKYMKFVNTEYARYYNEKNGRVGFVFRDRFKSQAITNNKYLYQCINYIHLNPVKAGIVRSCEEYKYSSYNEYINNSGVTKNEIFGNLFDGRKFSILDNVAKCSDFIDEKCDKNLIINEYILDFIKEKNLKVQDLFTNRNYMDSLIRKMSTSTFIRKKDIQEKLGITWRIINSIIYDM